MASYEARASSKRPIAFSTSARPARDTTLPGWSRTGAVVRGQRLVEATHRLQHLGPARPGHHVVGWSRTAAVVCGQRLVEAALGLEDHRAPVLGVDVRGLLAQHGPVGAERLVVAAHRLQHLGPAVAREQVLGVLAGGRLVAAERVVEAAHGLQHLGPAVLGGGVAAQDQRAIVGAERPQEIADVAQRPPPLAPRPDIARALAGGALRQLVLDVVESQTLRLGGQEAEGLGQVDRPPRAPLEDAERLDELPGASQAGVAHGADDGVLLGAHPLQDLGPAEQPALPWGWLSTSSSASGRGGGLRVWPRAREDGAAQGRESTPGRCSGAP